MMLLMSRIDMRPDDLEPLQGAAKGDEHGRRGIPAGFSWPPLGKVTFPWACVKLLHT